ncbi:porin PorA family protein, partial [Nocardia sp. NPDC060220]|uniref:porin PorA family protein n=1 Tax=Nocardia sp. NPDC060220 TaxID=3347076 RepID=UPI00364DA13C
MNMNPSRVFTALFALVGVLLIAGALVLRLGVEPRVMRISYESGGSGRYIGTLVIPDADPGIGGATSELAIEAQASAEVLSLSGDTAIVETHTEIFTVPRSSEVPMQVDRHIYAVNRQDYGQAPAVGDTLVEDQRGAYVIGFPPDAKLERLFVYDSATQQAQPLTFEGTTALDGRTMNRLRVDVTAALKDPAVLEQVRGSLGQKFGTDGTAIPKAALAVLGVPAAIITRMPDQIPVSYMQHTVADLLVDRRFGTIVDTKRITILTANIEVAGEKRPITLSATTVQASDELVSS